MRTLLVAATFAAAACTSGYHQDAARVVELRGAADAVVTPLHYFQSGRQAVDLELAAHPELAAALERARAACVRVEVRLKVQGSSYFEVQGSGFLIGRKGHVLTSGHSLDEGAGHGIRVTLFDGRAYDAEVLLAGHEPFGSTNADLALLALDTDEELPGLEIGAPRRGEVVAIAGYPDKLGINRDGLVVSGVAYQEAPLDPLLTLAVVEDSSPVMLRPLAGAIPVGGMSGSPVLDAQGRAVGVFNEVVTTPERDGVVYEYGASSSIGWPAEVFAVSR